MPVFETPIVYQDSTSQNTAFQTPLPQKTGSVGFAIQRASSGETHHLQEWQDQTNAVLGFVNQYGEFTVPRVGIGSLTSQARFTVGALSASDVVAIFQAYATSPTGDIAQFVGSGGTFHINATGNIVFIDNTIQSTAGVPLTGGTMTGQLVLPAAGVKFSNGTTQTVAALPLTGGTLTGQMVLPAAGIQFSNGTTQTVAALPLTGGTLTGQVVLPAAGVAFSDATVQTTAYKTLTSRSTGGSQTLVLGDANNVVESSSATAITLTIPPNSSVAYPQNTVIEIYQNGAGQITLAAGTGVTFQTPSSLTTRAEYSTIAIRQRAANVWAVSGDLT